MINDGLKNETLTKELLSKGSSVITTRNDFGVHVFSGSLDDGVVSGRLGRPKYNIDELQKTVNTTITELVPVKRPTPPRTVPFEVYNDALTDIADRDTTIERLNVTNSNLQSRITELETENQSLDIEIDGARTLQSIAENQSQIANNRVSSTIQQLQFSIQKATQEAMQRASLQARNDVLLTENASLRELLYGKSAQVQAGAKSSGTLFTVNPQPQTDTSEAPIRASQRFVPRAFIDTINRSIDIVNGERLTVFNASPDEIEIKIQTEGNTDWFSLSETSFKLRSNETKVITLTTKQFWNKKSEEVVRNYNGEIKFTGTGKNGNTEPVDFKTVIRRYK
jgi:hypothetical protein